MALVNSNKRLSRFFSAILFFCFSMDSLEQFVRDFLFGKIEPHIKSEPVPDSNDEPVKVI